MRLSIDRLRPHEGLRAAFNFVPVPYPDYPPASLTMKPGERQLWRVLNASAITYLNLAILFRRAAQPLGSRASPRGCPATRLKVQGWFADEVPPAFEAVKCLACTRTHLINRSTGRVLGSDAHAAIASRCVLCD